jgi:hypothetical protein
LKLCDKLDRQNPDQPLGEEGRGYVVGRIRVAMFREPAKFQQTWPYNGKPVYGLGNAHAMACGAAFAWRDAIANERRMKEVDELVVA